MRKRELRVLAVGDPAVSAYVDSKYGILDGYGRDVQFEAVPWENYYNKMTEVFAGKAAYDIVMVAGHLWAYDFVRRGYLEELSYDFEDILPVIAQEMKPDGKTYLSPSFCDGHIITYRKSVLWECLGETWGDIVTPQEFVRAVRVIGEQTGKPSVVLKADVSEIFTDALPYLRMNGGDVYEGAQAVCNAPGIIDGLEQYCSLRAYAPAGTQHFGNGEVAAAIRENRVPLAVTWSGQMGVVYTDDCVDKEDIGFATFPTAWNVSWSFAVSARSDKKKEAEAFLAYLRSREVDGIAGGESGAPVRRSSYEKGREIYPWYDCQLKMFELAAPLPNMENAGERNDVFYREIAEAFAGNKTPAQAMADAQEEINRIG